LDWTMHNAEILDVHRVIFNAHLNAIRETLGAPGTGPRATVPVGTT